MIRRGLSLLLLTPFLPVIALASTAGGSVQGLVAMRLQGYVRDRMLIAVDSQADAARETLTAYANSVLDEPLSDGVNRMLDVIESPNGKSYESFKATLARAYDVAPGDFDDVTLNKAYQLGMELAARAGSNRDDLVLLISGEGVDASIVAMLEISGLDGKNARLTHTPWQADDVRRMLGETSYRNLTMAVTTTAPGLEPVALTIERK